MKSPEERLKELEAELASVRKQLEEGRAPRTPKPWNPESGLYTIDVSGKIHKSLSPDSQNSDWQPTGRVFKTEETAELASQWFTFYQRLYKLAEYCNAKFEEKPERFGVLVKDHKWCCYLKGSNRNYLDSFFTSKASAQEACDIMNRDQWAPPTELP